MKKSRMQLIATGLLALSLPLVGLQTALAQDAAEPAPAQQAAQEAHDHDAPHAEPLPNDAQIVKISGETYTVEQLKVLAGLRPAPEGYVEVEGDIPLLRGDELLGVARYAGAFDILAPKADEKEITLDERETRNIENTVGRYVDSILYKKIVTDHMTAPTKETLDDLYERTREADFRVKEELRMRHIFVSTYADYTVQAGDTLEGIAETVGGDKSLADKILDDSTKRPRIEIKDEVKDGEPAPLEPRPLQEGEKLKVPIGGDKIDDARKKIDAAYKRLKDGDTFEDVARELSENENPGQLWIIKPEDQERPIMPELKDAFMSVEDGKFSEPIRTKHGFQIVYREKYQPPSFVDREQAEAKLKLNFETEQRKALVDKFFADCLNDSDLIAFNSDNLQHAAEEGKEKEPLFKIGEKEFSFSDLNSDGQAEIKNAKADDLAAIRAILAKQRGIQQAVVAAYIDKEKLKDEPMPQFVRRIQTNTLKANKYLNATADEKLKDIPQEDLEKFFEDNKQAFRQQEAFDLYKITRMVGTLENPEQTAEQLKKDLAAVQSLEEFRAKADEINVKGDPRVGEGGAMGRVLGDRMPDDEVEVIRSTTAPGKTEPIIMGGVVEVFWVQEAIPAKDFTLDEKREDVENAYRRRKRPEIVNALLQETREQVQVEPLVK